MTIRIVAPLFSLTFCILTYSNALAEVGEHNKEYMDIIIRVLCFILGVFSFFYIWYATNVFLTRRKKEIGIYIFMGLSGEKIGKMRKSPPMEVSTPIIRS